MGVKYIKILLAAAMLLFSLVVSGCGEDKLVGSWYMVPQFDENAALGDPNCYVQVKIEKGDDGYLVSKTSYAYWYVDEKINKSNKKVAEYDLSFVFGKFFTVFADEAVELNDDDKLVVKRPYSTVYTYEYDDKNDTLVENLRNHKGRLRMVFKKESKEDMQKFKEKCRHALEEKYRPGTKTDEFWNGIGITSKIKSIKFLN